MASSASIDRLSVSEEPFSQVLLSSEFSETCPEDKICYNTSERKCCPLMLLDHQYKCPRSCWRSLLNISKKEPWHSNYIELHVQLTTVPLKVLSNQLYFRYVCYAFYKLIFFADFLVETIKELLESNIFNLNHFYFPH